MVAQSPPFALQNAQHSAALFRQAAFSPWSAGGILETGELAVTAQSTPNMSVQVAAGRAWIPGTQVSNVSGGTFTTQGAYYGLNDAPVTLTVSAADPTNPRIDLVVAYVQDTFYSGATNALTLGVITGTPAASPAAPTAPSNALSLATIAVSANATSVGSGNIAQLGTLAAPRGQGRGMARAQLRQTAATGTYAAGWATLPFHAADKDTHGGWSSTTNPTRWTCPAGQGGTYLVEGKVQLGGNTTLNCRVLKNGAAPANATGISAADASLQATSSGMKTLDLVPGDYIEVQGFNSTANWSTATYTDGCSALTVTRIT